MRDLKDKVVVIAGATGGVGSVLVEAFLKEGAVVVAVGQRATLRNQNRLFLARANLLNVLDVRMVVDRVKDVYGTIDILINAVGIVKNEKTMFMRIEDFEAVVDTNLMPTFLMTRAIIPIMAKQKHGNIVNIGSVVGETGGYGCSNYAAAKAALVGFTKAVANEEAPDILVNLLSLGYMEVGMGAKIPEKVREKIKVLIPLRRFGTAQEFTEAVMFLATTTYMTGNVLKFAGGL